MGLLALVLLGMPDRVAAASDPEQALRPSWHSLPDRSGWQMVVSPAFPVVWPVPKKGGALVRYAFAIRVELRVADGATVAAPWARLVRGVDGGVLVERLSERLQPIGIQGVRPLDRAELSMIGREREAADRLTAGDVERDSLVRDFTCGWLGRQGVVAAAILPRHPDFARWLACP